MNLYTSDSGHTDAYLLYQIQDNCLLHIFIALPPLVIIKRLTAFTKQFAIHSHSGCRMVLPYFEDCLVPDFFRISIPNSFWAVSMSISSAVIFRLACFNSAANCLFSEGP